MIHNTDIVIIGGGIAGLWTLHKLKQQGYKVLLLEADALGAGQTIKSQGIIHGGLKYALNGDLTAAANALSDMPTYWQQCLNGSGEIDLSGVKILANGQYMWSINKLTGGIATLFASAALSSHVKSIPEENWPNVIRDSAIKGKLYQLEETVLDIPSLLKILVAPHMQDCIKIDSPETCHLELDAQNNIRYITASVNNQPLKIAAQQYIFTAGSGNANLLKNLANPPVMQRRPLQMVLVKSANLEPIYGHCVGLGATPIMTITSHVAKDKLPVWYLGGKVAEDGVNLTPAEQIKTAQQQLATLFPQLDLNNATWASFMVDRAEAKQANGSKPNSTTVFKQNNAIIAWPTKLALAPLLAAEVLDILQAEQILPSLNAATNTGLDTLPHPAIATPIWDQLL